MTASTLVGGTKKIFQFSFCHIILFETLLKTILGNLELDPKVGTAIRLGVQKFSEYFLRSSSRPATLTRYEGAKEEDFKEAVRSFIAIEQMREQSLDFAINVEESFIFDLGIVQEQFGCDENDAFMYLISFILICDILEKNSGAIHIYVGGQVNHVVIDEVTPWCDIRCEGNISYTPPH